MKLVEERKIKNLGKKGIPHAKAGEFVQERATWRIYRPVIDYEKCTRCLTCWFRCPDAAYKVDKKGYPHPDMKFCKGCMICVRECPVKCIRAEKEKK